MFIQTISVQIYSIIFILCDWYGGLCVFEEEKVERKGLTKRRNNFGAF